MNGLVYLLSVVVLTLVALLTNNFNDEHFKAFQDFITKYDKNYNSVAEFTEAFKHFSENYDEVKAHNDRFAVGDESYEKTVYPFMDQSFSELFATKLGTELPPEMRALFPPTKPDVSTYPEGPRSVDFKSDCLPPVEQGKCSSCWSFSAMAHLETVYKRKTPTFNTPLGQQRLVDCDTSNKACSGGWPRKALEYAMANGVVANTTYPYTAVNGTCKTVPKMSLPSICQVYQYDLNRNETYLKNILAATGPVVIALQVTSNFFGYKSGVFSDTGCANDCKLVNHGVLLVGYGSDPELEKRYWLIRNSWGPDWGEDGYIRIERGLLTDCLSSCYAIFSKLC